MNNSEFVICLFCCVVSTCGVCFFDYRYFSQRLKFLSDRIDKLVLQVESLEMECDKLDKYVYNLVLQVEQLEMEREKLEK